MRSALKDTTQWIALAGVNWLTPWIAPSVHESPSALKNRAIQIMKSVDFKSWSHKASIHDGLPSIHLFAFVSANAVLVKKRGRGALIRSSSFSFRWVLYSVKLKNCPLEYASYGFLFIKFSFYRRFLARRILIRLSVSLRLGHTRGKTTHRVVF